MGKTRACEIWFRTTTSIGSMNSVLIIGSVWPEPKSSAAGSHMMQLISAFRSNRFKITFVSACTKTENAFDLSTLGISQKEIQLNHSSFDDFISRLDPSIVVFDRYMTEEQFGWRVMECCPNALRILNTEDLHFLRKGRQHALTENKPFGTEYLFNDTAKRELASIYRSDLSLIISEAEMKLLKDEFNVDSSLLHYFPFMVEPITKERMIQLPKVHERNHFVTIGNYLHAPNFDAVIYLKEVIWPVIRRQLPKAEMHVYGAYLSQKAKQLHDVDNGFHVNGFIEDVNEIMKNAKVCLAPIRFGAGLKGKIVDAMQNGTPCITTTIGAEGLYGGLEPNGYVIDDPKEFATMAVQLYLDENIWQSKQENGFKVINERFNGAEHQIALLDRIEALQQKLDTHRMQNFTGAMLQYHSLQSTKYMSRWIEEKNKTN